MSNEHFNIFCCWHNKNETTTELGAMALQTFDAVSRIMPGCECWEVLDLKAEAMVPLGTHREDMTALVERGVAHDDFRNPDPYWGYHVSGGTPHENSSEEIKIRIRGAMQSPHRNYGSLGLDTPETGALDPALANYSVIRSVMITFIEIWRPLFGGVRSSALDPFNRLKPGLFDLAWMTYISPPLARHLGPLGDISVELVRGGGLLMTACKETFDVSNQAHMEAAEAIRIAAAPLNRIMGPPWNRR
jgi:Immunity protein 52